MMTIWQSLVVLWDTAGVLWAHGYDALAPKPESSFDESFVGSNAVVQTSVIVWYLLCIFSTTQPQVGWVTRPIS